MERPRERGGEGGAVEGLEVRAAGCAEVVVEDALGEGADEVVLAGGDRDVRDGEEHAREAAPSARAIGQRGHGEAGGGERMRRRGMRRRWKVEEEEGEEIEEDVEGREEETAEEAEELATAGILEEGQDVAEGVEEFGGQEEGGGVV